MGIQLLQECSCSQIQTQELRLEVDAICPRCQYNLTEEEVRAGWSQNRTDIKTTCPACKLRFIALLLVEEAEEAERRVNFMCINQVFFKIKCIIKERKSFTKKYGKSKCPDIYYTLCKHFDSFENGMEKYLKRNSRKKRFNAAVQTM